MHASLHVSVDIIGTPLPTHAKARSSRYEQCGCINPKYWNARSILLPSTNKITVAALCNISDKCYSQTGYAFMTDSSLYAKYCSFCLPQCSVTSFHIQPSAWKAPPEWLQEDIKLFAENSGIPLPTDWSSKWRSHVDASYLSVELIHESSVVENYTQTPTLTAVDLLSNVGGQTGLWIGVSFLSLMELAEMLYRLIRNQCRIFWRTRYVVPETTKL